MTAQPDERMRKVPAVKMATTYQGGTPPAAIHKAQSVGHSKSRVPIGLSMRTSLTYKGRRWAKGNEVMAARF